MRTTTKKEVNEQVIMFRHQLTQQLFELTDFEYNLNQYEYGMKFLDQLFDQQPDRVIPIATQKSYWRWWCDEWNRWEAELLDFIFEHHPVVFQKFWHDEMDALVGDHLTTSSFKNYLKIFHNVRL